MRVLSDAILVDDESAVFRIHSVYILAVFVLLDDDAGKGLFADGRTVDHERVARVKRIHTEGRAVLIPRHIIGENETRGDAADVHPVNDLFVFGLLVLSSHELIELTDALVQRVIAAGRDVADRLVQEIRRLERHDLIRTVHRDNVVDVLTDVFLFEPDVLPPSVVVPKIGDLSGIRGMHGKRGLQNVRDIRGGDLRNHRLDLPPTGQAVFR